MDEDGDFQGWIELYNGGDNAIELTGYYLSNDPQQPRRWRFRPAMCRLTGFW